MNGLNKCLDEMKFDTRLVNFNIENGIVTREEYEAYLKTLNDVADKSMLINLDAGSAAAEAPVQEEVPATPTTPNSFF